MFSFRSLAVVSFSTGVGYVLGLETNSETQMMKLPRCITAILPQKAERLRTDHDLDLAENQHIPSWYKLLPVPGTVHAATVALDRNLPATPTSTPVSTAPTNRAVQIMKHGYPGFDNVRYYEDFVVSYDRRNRTAHWVFEHIKGDNCTYAEGVDRSKCSDFRPDLSIHPYFRATNADYKGSGYDRGHLAAASNHRHSQKAMDDTFVLSNISPQVGVGFNRGVWNSLEKYTRALARRNRSVYVCTGPLYLPRKEPDGKQYVKYEVIGANNVAVPTHFFKVLVVEDEKGQFEMKSFVMPNQALPEEIPLKAFYYPIDSIERAAGFLLFEKIPRKMFKLINGSKPQ
ncbi:hypothetical protein BaRGS_00028487 [Batillaria attramentaria]|uniref:Endonuclease G, mitochondrial n=1 Tax=Batillaria attramentaria TaxID=370345 RepID=A0ABD0JZ81_9CAEN